MHSPTPCEIECGSLWMKIMKMIETFQDVYCRCCCIDKGTAEVLEISALPAGDKVAITKLKTMCLKISGKSYASSTNSLCFVVGARNHEIAPTCCTIFACDGALVVRQHASTSRPRS